MHLCTLSLFLNIFFLHVERVIEPVIYIIFFIAVPRYHLLMQSDVVGVAQNHTTGPLWIPNFNFQWAMQQVLLLFIYSFIFCAGCVLYVRNLSSTI